MILFFTVSTADINIIVPSGPLYAGALSLTLTCTIYLNPATDSDIRLGDSDITWLRGDVPLLTGGRDTISALEGSRPTFTSRLTLTPLSTEDTTFTCQAVARPPLGLSFITVSGIGQQTVNVPVESESFLPQQVLSLLNFFSYFSSSCPECVYCVLWFSHCWTTSQPDLLSNSHR